MKLLHETYFISMWKTHQRVHIADSMCSLSDFLLEQNPFINVAQSLPISAGSDVRERGTRNPLLSPTRQPSMSDSYVHGIRVLSTRSPRVNWLELRG